MASDNPYSKSVRMLPTWLVASSCYAPPHDRDGFLRKNILSLTSVLLALRADPAKRSAAKGIDKRLQRVRPSLRLLGALALVLCVALARNMAFVWSVLVGWLLLQALRPARQIRSSLLPALGVGALAALVNVPALVLGQTAAPVRMASKSLVTAGVIADLAGSIGTEGVLAALRGLHVPARACMVLDLALRDVVLLGESALSLSEALALRSIGRDRTKTSSAAGAMGAVFVRAHAMATARAEAMELRGYDGRAFASGSARKRWGVPDVLYCVALVALVGLFAYLELSLS